IIPDWSGLIIEVVNQDNKPFRGEYEIVRFDLFEPFGRGAGREPNLAEELKTWIFKPGVYKIFGIGKNYNTMSNFVTVRLLPGELVRFILVIDQTSDKIIGGGMVQQTTTTDITSVWKYGVNVSGGVDFNYKKDEQTNTVILNNGELSLLLAQNLNYKNTPYELINSLTFDEKVSMNDFRLSSLENPFDEARLSSLFTWKMLPWLGPYARSEFISSIVPDYQKQNLSVSQNTFYYIILNAASQLFTIDSTATSYRLSPAFSPLKIESGGGATMSLPHLRFFEGNVLTGIGLKYSRWRKGYVRGTKDNLSLIADSTNPIIMGCKNNSITNYAILLQQSGNEQMDVGPELIMNAVIHAGYFITISSEVKFLSPFHRIISPDIVWRSLVSWRLFQSVTLDYSYHYELTRAISQDRKQHTIQQRVLLRFSYGSK
ncbi:MAG: hypothetical protein JW795_04535, partial [Chitinivibrionales bacterium]|nr:hypothetical protein [Chitinivibrionales bacterium]